MSFAELRCIRLETCSFLVQASRAATDRRSPNTCSSRYITFSTIFHDLKHFTRKRHGADDISIMTVNRSRFHNFEEYGRRNTFFKPGLGINHEQTFEEGASSIMTLNSSNATYLTADRWDNLRSVVILTSVECTPHPDVLHVYYSWNQASPMFLGLRTNLNGNPLQHSHRV